MIDVRSIMRPLIGRCLMSDAIFKTNYGPCKKTCIHEDCGLFRYLQSHRSPEMWEKVLRFLGDRQNPMVNRDGWKRERYSFEGMRD